MNSGIPLLSTISVFILVTWTCAPVPSSHKSQEDMLAEFLDPPNEARPRVWWHWMNGNVTKDGIRKDLEWMNRVGIRGFHNFDANLFTPVVVEKPLVFMTEEWIDAFAFTTHLADSLNFEMTIAGSPGWSVTGGPWVEPEDGMKKYVWTETLIQGGQTFSGELAQPSDASGNFQNIQITGEGFSGGYVGEIPHYYQDAMVIAYRLLNNDQSLSSLHPKLKTSGGDNFDVEFLTDGDVNTTRYLNPKEVGEEFWIQYEFDRPQIFKAVTIVGANHTALEQFDGGVENRRILLSDDGVAFREVVHIPGSIVPQNTVGFAPTAGKFWRLAYVTQPPAFNPFIALLGISTEAPKPEGVHLAELVFHTTDRIDQFEDKAGFSPWKEDLPTYLADGADAVAQSDIYDLTDNMNADGQLNWEVPEGNWAVLRFGYGLTGRQNHPASPAGTGLEVDKLDEEAVRRYINNYLDAYQNATGGLMGERGLQYIILDSYEAGHMNWTHDFPKEFKARRGYRISNWIPVLTGRIIESREASEKFLWDFRKTIGEMIAENHYDVIGEELKKRRMGRYTESHEGNRIYLADGMDVKRHADVPMAAMWTPGSLAGDTEEEVRSEADIREAASVAHIYGKRYVAAESMTSVGRAFQEHPERLKRTADLELASGLNRFVIHTSVHQPLDDKKPGFSLGPFGQYYGRQETWAEQSKVWIDYLSRSCFLLQQGRFVADALIYYGENTNITRNFTEALPAIPGYEYDFINSTGLIEAVSAEGGKMITPGGGSYSVLVLHESAKEMTLPVLKKIKELVDAGVAVTGTKPERTPTLADEPREFQTLVEAIWTSSNVTEQDAQTVLLSRGVEADVTFSGHSAKILYVHRSTPNHEIYWLGSRSADPNQADVSFRISGREPLLWHPQTGETKQISWRMENGRTIIPVDFQSWEAFFIVFGERTSKSSFTLPASRREIISTISSPWQLSFQEGLGAPPSITFENLTSWTEHANPGIKYFSGTATYTNRFQLNHNIEENRVFLDLGEVKNIATIIINGQHVGTLWKSPFNVDITNAVKNGENSLEIQVTNVWVNRLIGDALPGAKKKVTFITMPLVSANQPLLPSGLMGPVKVGVQSKN